ncbi:hypothetical protein HELRODRAFT_177764 [Helobdella robusta]|uniref:WSC domain-containing protein n=1 Tax=Helobdella robusta TaxID=6412 RepID=T1FC77_HELRO|nr:hypothetical protein HELRODRAFT_177764 [Helobdella robusta]ESN97705.1 hypothetical protein HELRODRAFT_177764 [Helobdella robusta]
MDQRKLSLVVFVVMFASYHPTAAIESVNQTLLRFKNYRGCYVGHGFHRSTYSFTSINSCYTQCKPSNSSYYCMRDKRTCVCNTTHANKVDTKKCNQRCSDGFPCGGNGFISVYEKATKTTQTLAVPLTDISTVKPTTMVNMNKCGVNNGGCGDSVCVEVAPDNETGVEANAGVKCYPPDKEVIKVPEIKVLYRYTYKGCFEKMHAKKELATASIESCFDFCSESFLYGVKDRKYCACANKLENEFKHCQTWKFFALEKSNQYVNVGCFKYLELEDKQDQSLSKSLCLNKCRELRYPYSGTSVSYIS